MKLCYLGTAHTPYGYKKTDLLSTSVLIGGRLLIQPTEDIFRFADRYALQEVTEGIEAILVTCSHPRAFSPTTIERLARLRPLRLFASSAVADMCRHIPNLTHIPLHPFRTVAAGDIHITPLPTGYTTSVAAEMCFCAHVEQGGRALYFGIPGGVPSKETVRFLGEHPIDGALLDAALGESDAEDAAGHLSLRGACLVREQLLSCGALCGRAYTMLSSLPAFASPDEKNAFSEKAKGMGFLVPYDGYFIDL